MKTDSPNSLVSRRNMIRSVAALGMAAPIALAAPSVARAQEAATPIVLADHPVVGFWELSPPGGHAIFHADGTYHEVNPYGFGVGIGIWRVTGERSADAIIRFPDQQEDAPIDQPVQGTVWWNVTVDEDGSTLSSNFSSEATDGGTSSGFVTGTRLTFETLKPR